MQALGWVQGSLQYLPKGFFPVEAPRELVVPWRRNLPTQVFQSIQEEGDKSLREVGKELGVSYESVRQARFDLMQKGSL